MLVFILLFFSVSVFVNVCGWCLFNVFKDGKEHWERAFAFEQTHKPGFRVMSMATSLDGRSP